jgi:hypothetical protein
MANGSNPSGPTSRQLVILCISLTSILNIPTFYILKEHASEMSEIRVNINTKTKDRYFRKDAEAHEKLDVEKFKGVDLKFKGVDFRFERDEAIIKKLEVYMEDCVRNRPQ